MWDIVSLSKMNLLVALQLAQRGFLLSMSVLANGALTSFWCPLPGCSSYCSCSCPRYISSCTSRVCFAQSCGEASNFPSGNFFSKNSADSISSISEGTCLPGSWSTRWFPSRATSMVARRISTTILFGSWASIMLCWSGKPVKRSRCFEISSGKNKYFVRSTASKRDIFLATYLEPYRSSSFMYILCCFPITNLMTRNVWSPTTPTMMLISCQKLSTVTFFAITAWLEETAAVLSYSMSLELTVLALTLDWKTSSVAVAFYANSTLKHQSEQSLLSSNKSLLILTTWSSIIKAAMIMIIMIQQRVTTINDLGVQMITHAWAGLLFYFSAVLTLADRRTFTYFYSRPLTMLVCTTIWSMYGVYM